MSRPTLRNQRPFCCQIGHFSLSKQRGVDGEKVVQEKSVLEELYMCPPSRHPVQGSHIVRHIEPDLNSF